jgi:hypothetical protein
MLPEKSVRLSFFNKHTIPEYIEWMCAETGVAFKAEMMRYRTSSKIDNVFIANLPPEPVEEEKPAWVEVAEEVVKEAILNDTEVDIEEDTEESIPEIEEIIPEIEEEVPELAPIIEEEIIPVFVSESESESESEEPVEEPSPIMTANPIFPAKDYNSMTISELREVCRERGITIRGTKGEVVYRLRKYDDGLLEQPNDTTEAPSQEAVEEVLDAPSQEAATEVNENAADSGQKQIDDTDE